MSHPLLDRIHVFKNEDGYVLNIHPAEPPEKFVISMAVAPGYRMFIPAEDAPAVALAILKSAGWPDDDRTSITHQILADLGRVKQITSQVAAEKELTRRRDAIAAEHGLGGFTYESASTPARSIINAVIQLQDEASK